MNRQEIAQTIQNCVINDSFKQVFQMNFNALKDDFEHDINLVICAFIETYMQYLMALDATEALNKTYTVDCNEVKH